jgi:hypothetical protein
MGGILRWWEGCGDARVYVIGWCSLLLGSFFLSVSNVIALPALFVSHLGLDFALAGFKFLGEFGVEPGGWSTETAGLMGCTTGILLFSLGLARQLRGDQEALLETERQANVGLKLRMDQRTENLHAATSDARAAMAESERLKEQIMDLRAQAIEMRSEVLDIAENTIREVVTISDSGLMNNRILLELETPTDVDVFEDTGPSAPEWSEQAVDPSPDSTVDPAEESEPVPDSESELEPETSAGDYGEVENRPLNSTPPVVDGRGRTAETTLLEVTNQSLEALKKQAQLFEESMHIRASHFDEYIRHQDEVAAAAEAKEEAQAEAEDDFVLPPMETTDEGGGSDESDYGFSEHGVDSSTVGMLRKSRDVQEGGKLDRLLLEAVDKGASDLHLSGGQVPRCRIHGEIIRMDEFETFRESEVYYLVESLMSSACIEEFVTMNDCDFAYSLEGVARFRVNLCRLYAKSQSFIVTNSSIQAELIRDSTR